MPPRTVKPEEMFARNTLDLESRVTRRRRLADSDSLGYVRGARTKGSVASMAIALRSNSPISYPILSAGAFRATLAIAIVYWRRYQQGEPEPVVTPDGARGAIESDPEVEGLLRSGLSGWVSFGVWGA